MRMILAVTAALIALPLAGCLDAAERIDTAGTEPVSQPPAEPFLLAWQGHVMQGSFDLVMHSQPTEPLLYDVQPAGFPLHIDDQPDAIEVMVSWAGDAGFYLHPHYVVEEEPETGGTSTYYGYFSDLFETSPGCIRIPEADMAAGHWQMMIHPTRDTMDVDFTITVGVEGATAEMIDEMHGHRWDGPSDLTDHGWDECQFLANGE